MTNKPNASKNGWPTTMIGPGVSAGDESIFTFITTEVLIIKSINVKYTVANSGSVRRLYFAVTGNTTPLGGSASFTSIAINSIVNAHATLYENAAIPVDKPQTQPKEGEIFVKMRPIELPIGSVTVTTISPDKVGSDQFGSLQLIVEKFIPSGGS